MPRQHSPKKRRARYVDLIVVFSSSTTLPFSSISSSFFGGGAGDAQGGCGFVPVPFNFS